MVTFDQFKASLLNKMVNFLKKILLGPKIWNAIFYF